MSDEDFSVLDKWNGFNETVTVNLTIKNKTTGLVTNILDNNWNYTVNILIEDQKALINLI